NGIGSIRNYIQTQGVRLNNQFQNEIIKRSKLLSQRMQGDLNNSVDRGAVGFTQRSILFFYRKVGRNSVTSTIMVKDIQAKYLYQVLVQPKAIDKFIPTSSTRLTKQGNISGLKKNLLSERYKVVKGKNGKERLIDTAKKDTKKKTKRVIGLREKKQRRLIY
ncbi:TPA: hypothetical protein ACHU4M_004577, partial [Shigella sonnei]